MSLAEIEKQVTELPEEERREFVNWVYENEHRLAPPEWEEGEVAPEVMEELMRRREELDSANVKLYTPDEVHEHVGKALDEIRRSRH